jgi:hypothetical protein
MDWTRSGRLAARGDFARSPRALRQGGQRRSGAASFLTHNESEAKAETLTGGLSKLNGE